MARIVGVRGGGRSRAIDSGWEHTEVAAGSAKNPSELDALATTWSHAIVPGTVASARRQSRTWSFEKPYDFDAGDHWYRVAFTTTAANEGDARILRFDGLATLAEIFVDGAHLLSTDDMFRPYEVDVSALDAGTHTLHIRFRSLTAHLAQKRPRPRWKTKLVTNNQLRWARTTLLGRMPGWSPPVAPVGPYRSVVLEEIAQCRVERAELRAKIDGTSGIVDARIYLRSAAKSSIRAVLRSGEHHLDLRFMKTDERDVFEGTLRIPNVETWWPHTHGAQPLYPISLEVHAGAEPITIALGHVAFRTIALSTEGGRFELAINGVPIFCRGACWTTPDIVTLGAPDDYEPLVRLARDAGMNMLRVGGTMIIEHEAFFDACDRLGVMVWQDFPFANLDYPDRDESFLQLVQQETESIARALETHPSLTVLCGGSEVHQQIAMLGLDPALWAAGASQIFDRVLPEAARRMDIPYVPSSPQGGALPFHNDVGCSHYYGVGAYLRPLEDARRASVKFTSECLGFANVPSERTLDTLLDGDSPAHHPRWKERVPRDRGAGWDFDDVRDHYLATLFDVDPAKLRYADMERYLELSRVVTGDVMAATLSEWRLASSTCKGALIWFFQDLWPGAGWGIIEANREPKAAYFILRRVLAPIALLLADEGLNGLRAHVVNDTARSIHGKLTATLYRRSETVTATASRAIDVSARGQTMVVIDELLGSFRDITYAYRFGPPAHDLALVTFESDDGAIYSQQAFFPLGRGSVLDVEPDLTASFVTSEDGSSAVILRARRFARAVHIELPGCKIADDYVDVAPGGERTIEVLTRGTDPPRGFVKALGSRVSAPIEIVRR